MTVLGKMRGLMGFMASVCMSTCACNRCTSSLDASATDSPSAHSVSDAYHIVSRRLRHLEKFRAPSTGIIRSVPGNTLAVEVDEKLRVHALRADWPERHYNYDAVLVTMLYGIIDTEAPPQWRTVAEIDYPESPILLLDGVQTIAALLGTTTGKKSGGAGALLLLPLNPLDAGTGAKPTLCINHVGATVRPTIDENGRVLAVTHEDYDPIEDRYAAGLRVIRCHAGTGEVLSPLIPGTFHEKTFPQDYAIHIGATGEMYIVYEGVRNDAEAEGSQLWRLTLDSKGKLIESKALAKGVDVVYGLWLLAAPDGQVHAFELYGALTAPQTTSDKLGYRILPLGVMGRKKGSALNFVIDPWVQAHAISFENDEIKHLGPEAIPPGKEP